MIAASALGLALLVLVPADALWRDLRKSPPRSRTQRYLITIIKAVVLLAALLLVINANKITAADLGLSLGSGGRIGLALAFVVITGLTVTTLLARPNAKNAQSQSASLMPQGLRELGLFLVLTPLIGFAWELLYRGFLLWWLTPLIGMPFAVVSASLAYGLAHGWKNARASLFSIVSAFLFTIGYAATHSLWWLIIIHIGLPLIGCAALWRAMAAGPAQEELQAA